MLPGVGFVFDTANSIYYFSEGDYLNGAMSAASAIPAVGDAFAAAKKGSKGLGIAAKVGSGAVKPYEVTTYEDFKARSVKGDGLEPR